MKKISKVKLNKNIEEIKKYKVAYPKAVKKGGVPYKADQIFILNKNQICTETYMVIESFETEKEARFLLEYLQTDFVRFLLSIKKITQDITKETWSLVPQMSTYQGWNNKKLYEYFKLSKQEIDYIERKVKEWF